MQELNDEIWLWLQACSDWQQKSLQILSALLFVLAVSYIGVWPRYQQMTVVRQENEGLRQSIEESKRKLSRRAGLEQRNENLKENAQKLPRFEQQDMPLIYYFSDLVSQNRLLLTQWAQKERQKTNTGNREQDIWDFTLQGGYRALVNFIHQLNDIPLLIELTEMVFFSVDGSLHMQGSLSLFEPKDEIWQAE